ncbi:MAG: TetR/AcrR family transcriptional regulator [Planctomycetota bacterium]
MPAAQRREQLLDTAAELFAQQGYARATTSQLAKAAGVTEPIIYRHFKSKRDLFVALIERTGEETLEGWREHIAGASDPADRLKRLFGDNPMVQPKGRAAYRVFLQAISESDDEAIHKAVDDHLRGVHRFLADALQTAQDAGQVPKRFAPDVLAWLLIDLGLGYGVCSAMEIQGHGRGADGTHVQEVIATAMIASPLPHLRDPSSGDPADAAG